MRIEPVLAGVFEEFADGKSVTPGGRVPAHSLCRSDAEIRHRQARPAQSAGHHRRHAPLREVGLRPVREDRRLRRRRARDPGAEHQREEPQVLRRHERLGAQAKALPGLGYVTRKGGEFGGPIAKNHGPESMAEALRRARASATNDGLFFAAGKEKDAAKLAGAARTRVGEELGLIEEGCFKFCWIVDFPMFEYDEDLKKVDFSHNPFSMPQGEMEALETKDPLEILAWQYDIVCNGYELSSGAIRNHRPDIMYKAFEIAGYSQGRRRRELLGHDRGVQARRAAAWRLGAGHRPHRHAAGRRAEHPRSHRLPDEPEGAGPDDGRAEQRSAATSCANSLQHRRTAESRRCPTLREERLRSLVYRLRQVNDPGTCQRRPLIRANAIFQPPRVSKRAK